MNGGLSLKLTMQQIGYALIILLGCLSFAIFLTINSVWLFDLNIHALHLSAATGMSAERMHEEYLRMINYIQNPLTHSLNFKYFISSPNGLQHFKDVRHLVIFNNVMAVIFVPVSFVLVRRLNKKSLTWMLLTPVKTVVIFSLVIVSIMIVNFEQVFIYFHELLFRNSDWIFDPDLDPVINMLPDTFFFECFTLFFIVFLALHLWLYILAKKSLRSDPPLKSTRSGKQ
ncbi:TIGR01906 family membrane protein [Lentilactobacillus hilgardii]|uniref:TIGR01906 family membrane protein n=1 Tax=Lentilactobacillus hilgardii TaxID=1588 RepID=UPI003FA57712